MNKKLLIPVAAISALVVLVIGWGFWYGASMSTSIEERITKKLALASSLNVKVVEASVDFWSGEFSAAKITLHDQGEDTKPMIIMNDVVAEFSPYGMFWGPVEVQKINVSKPELNLLGSGSRILNWSRKIDPAKHKLEVEDTGTLLVIEDVNIPAGTVHIGPGELGSAVTSTRSFPETRLAALGVNEGGIPSEVALREILYHFSRKALVGTNYADAE